MNNSPSLRSDCEDDPVLDGGDQGLDWDQEEDCAVTRNCGDEETFNWWAWLFGWTRGYKPCCPPGAAASRNQDCRQCGMLTTFMYFPLL